MNDENWITRAQSAESKLSTMRQSHELAAERIKNFKRNFGIRELYTGEISIDFQEFVKRLGKEQCKELMKVIKDQFPK